MKYVMLETSEGQKLPFVFPEAIVHADMARLMCRVVALSMKTHAEIVSAGFCEVQDVTVHGKSESLGDLDSRPVDAAYIELGAAIAFSDEGMAAAMLEMARNHKR